jgi:glutamate synthase (NADPH/NADH) large chain
LICSLKGAASHDIVAQALEILRNLAHRGACGCDAATGDGAGILIQLPDAFLRLAGREEKINLPDPGRYASGLVFLPVDANRQDFCRRQIETVTANEGQRVLGWRQVPVRSDAHGPLSRHIAPAIFQIFIGSSDTLKDQDHFERKLFVIRKLAERTILKHGLLFHIPSLSSRTFVYKGMFLAHQLEAFFPELADGTMQSAMALVHQRYSTNTFPAWDLAQPFRFLCHNGEINTLGGNLNWLKARETIMASDLLGNDLAKVLPVATPGASDSATLDAMLELLYHSGRSLPHGIMMLIPEAWQQHPTMPAAKKEFYEYHAGLMEPSWPYYPMRLRTSTSHAEGGQRQWDILTKAFIGRTGRVEKLKTVNFLTGTTDLPGKGCCDLPRVR